jgi:ribonuclease E
MGVILRTAGESRTKAEIKRDYEYLMRMWDNVRNLTLQSTAPALVYEEGSLIKRSVRDLYNKDIDEILVAGEDGYREAKDFMRMLMPSHAKAVQPYRETTPIFVRSGIEAQLDRMLQPQVTLKSGGYLIINQTEALVAIDVNSGRSTREHSIEETALHTNLEAAEEVARQLRLRDLAGLIVIDFIDMEENRNNRAVEKKLKDCLKNDRARIQVGRISHFGLLEMSRQRIRASVLESTMKPCPHCGGTGHVRSDSSVGLAVVRAIEEFLLKDSKHHITVRTPVSTALYVLNHKRATLTGLERRFQLTVTIEADDSVGTQHYVISRGAVIERPEGFVEPSTIVPAVMPEDDEDEEIVAEEETEDEDKAESQADSASEGSGEGGDRRKRRRRRRRGGRDRGDHHEAQTDEHAADAADGDAVAEDVPAEAGESEPEPGLAEAIAEEVAAEPAEDAKKRRRGKRGGRKNRTEDDTPAAGPQEAAEEAPAAETVPVAEADAAPAAEAVAEPETVAAEPPAKPKRARRTTKAKKAEEAAIAEEPARPAVEAAVETAPVEEVREEIAVAPAVAEPAARARPSRRRASASPAPTEPVVSSAAPSAEPEGEQKPKKVGWWQKRSFF